MPEKMSTGKQKHQEQLADYKKNHPKLFPLAMANGAPIGNRLASLTVGPLGPILMQDIAFFDEMAKFNRERVPERVVHAKGGGAHGFFEVTNDEITKYCKANLFSAVGKKTPMFIRFSTVAGEHGSADTARDPRGFAMKFYTEEGNWDLVANNTPVFFIRDAVNFPHFIHSQKRNPTTMLRDPNMAFDFFTSFPESTHQTMILFSDRGTPDGWRFMHGYGGNTFKLVNHQGTAVYCKFHALAKEIRNLPADVANKLKAIDPDYSIRDLYDAIERGDYPQWKLCVQIMTFDQAKEYRFNPFDVTKVWSHKEFPLIEVGIIKLNRNPDNYFAEVEQIAFSPARLVPGIEVSPDKMLQGRLFSYHDTQVHRIGPNYMQLPINCPYRTRVKNYQRDGLMTYINQGSAPVYHTDSYNGPKERGDCKKSVFHVSGDVDRYNSNDDDNFTQPRDFWLKVLDENGRARLVANLALELHLCKPFIQERAINTFANVHADFGRALQKALNELIQKTNQPFRSEGSLGCCGSEFAVKQFMESGSTGLSSRKMFMSAMQQTVEGDKKLNVERPHQFQMDKFKEEHPVPDVLTMSNGEPIYNRKALLTVGPRGPALLQDTTFLDEMSHFDHERVPERVVHANGFGVHGYFEVTDDITKYCKAELFDGIGKRTPVFVRFSTVASNRGEADTMRDLRGFAIKFYTKEGNWDLLNLSVPVFFVKDPILFPSAMRILKRNPVTHLKDPNMSFDFWSQRPESVHTLMFLFGDRGIPDGFRFMNGYSQNPLKLVNKNDEIVFAKFHIKAPEFRTLNAKFAHALEGVDPDYAKRDMYDNIEKGNFPEWTFNMQIMTLEEAQKLDFNAFDITKVWPHKQFPLIRIGKLVLNRNVDNWFAETEQVAFNPAHVIPGIQLSTDTVLQGRTFAYQDTQFYRIGTNYIQLPINRPYRAEPYSTTRIDGAMCYNNNDGAPVYHPNSFNGPKECKKVTEQPFEIAGKVARYDSKSIDDNFSQARVLWNQVYDIGCRNRFVENIAQELRKCDPEVQERFLEMLANVDSGMVVSIREILSCISDMGQRSIIGL